MLLVVIAGVLLFAHGTDAAAAPPFTGWLLIVAGVIAGFIIGVIAALLGVAGGEFLIPTLVLLFGVDIKLAGSLSLAVSLPTMLVGYRALQSRPKLCRARTELGVPAGHGGHPAG